MMTVNEVNKRWLSEAEAQKYLGVGRYFMHALRNDPDPTKQHIPFYKFGKTIWYDIKDLDDFVISNKVV